MSAYRPSYISPPSETDPNRNDRSFSRRYNTQDLNVNDDSYQDLKKEYSKVLNYVDSVRHDRSYNKTSLDSATDRRTCPDILSLSTTDKSYYSSTGGKIKSTSNRYPESEKRVIELEQEVSELKKLLDSSSARIVTLQRENQNYQERLKDFRQIDQSNKQLSYEMKTIDYEIDNITKKMRELERENARLVAEKGTGDQINAFKEYQKNLTKYSNYVLYLISTLDDNHYGRFCFEERFISQQELLKQIDAQEKDKLLVQSFRYIADLLLNVSSAKNFNTSGIIPPKKEGQAYLVDLNEAYNSVPKPRSNTHTIPKEIEQSEERGEIRSNYSKNSVAPAEKSRRIEDDPRRRAEERRKITDNYNDTVKKLSYEVDKRAGEDTKEDHKTRQFIDNNERQYEDREISQIANKSVSRDQRPLTPRETEQYISRTDREDRRYDEMEKKHYTVRTQGEDYEGSQLQAKNREERLHISRDLRQDFESTDREERKYLSNEPQRQSSIRNEKLYHERDYRNTQERQYTNSQERKYIDIEEPQYIRKEDRKHSNKTQERQYNEYKEPKYIRRDEGQPSGKTQERLYSSGNQEKYSNSREDLTYGSKDRGQYIKEDKAYKEPRSNIRQVSRNTKAEDYQYNESQRRSYTDTDNHQRKPNQEVRYREVPPQKKGEYQQKQKQHHQPDPARRAVTEEIYAHYDEDLPQFLAPPVQRESLPQRYDDDSSRAQSHRSSSPQYKNYTADDKEYEALLEEQSQDSRAPKMSKQSSTTIKGQQSIGAPKSPKSVEPPSATQSELRSAQSTKKVSDILNAERPKATPTESNLSRKQEPLSGSRQPRDMGPKSGKKSPNLLEPPQYEILTKPQMNREDQAENEYYEQRYVPASAQQREDFYNEEPSNKLSLNISNPKKNVQKQLSLKSPSEKSETNRRENKSKSPVGRSTQATTPVAQNKMKEKRIPSPISTPISQTQTGQSSVKLLSPANSQVSQIVYNKNAKNKRESDGTNVPERRDEGEIIQKDHELIEREKELITRIRELREKEKELMEKEKEFDVKDIKQTAQQSKKSGDFDQPTQKTKDSRQSSFVSVKSPKESRSYAEIKAAQRAAAAARSQKEERYRENDEESNERPVMRQESSSSNQYSESGRSPNIKSILKNNESGYRGEGNSNNSRYANEEGSSTFRTSLGAQGNPREFTGYETNEDRGRKGSNPFIREECQNQSGNELVSAETNHRKRLTFGTETNFEPDVSPSNNQSYIPSPEKELSKDQGTNFPSFKVSFGRTESKFRSLSPDPKLYSIMDVPRKKRSDNLIQTYDIINGQESVDYKEISSSPLKTKGSDVTPTGISRGLSLFSSSEVPEIQRADSTSKITERRVSGLDLSNL